MALVLFAILHVWAALKGAEGHAGEKSFLDLRVTNAENPDGDCTAANQDTNCASGVCELTTGTCQACFSNAEDACRAALGANGFTPGCDDVENGCDAAFAGYYAKKGCYAYKREGDPTYSGYGFFGTGGTIEMSEEGLTDPTVRIIARECRVECGDIELGEFCHECDGKGNFACRTGNNGMGRCDNFPSCSPPCELFTEVDCRAALLANGIIPNSSNFKGDYLVKGCYYYRSGKYSNGGFFGSGGTKEKMLENLTGPDAARILASECSDIK